MALLILIGSLTFSLNPGAPAASLTVEGGSTTPVVPASGHANGQSVHPAVPRVGLLINEGARWNGDLHTISNFGVAAKAGGSLADLYAGGRVATEAELRAYAEGEGWTLEQSATGPAKYVDENGVPRLTIKSGSSRTPGSEDPHIEVRDGTGQRTDPYGNPVNRRSPDNHYPYEP